MNLKLSHFIKQANVFCYLIPALQESFPVSRKHLLQCAVTLFILPRWSWADKAHTDQDLALRENMIVISRQLGVTCAHCHDTTNFKVRTKPAFQVSVDHMKMVNTVNSSGYKGLPKIDCFVCHRGEIKPAATGGRQKVH